MTVDQFRTADYIVKRQKDVLSIIREVEAIQNRAHNLPSEHRNGIPESLQGVINRLQRENARLLDEFKTV